MPSAVRWKAERATAEGLLSRQQRWAVVRQQSLGLLDQSQQWTVERARSVAILRGHFDPSQPRDEDGRWTDTGGGVPQGELFPGMFPPPSDPKKNPEIEDFEKDHVDLEAGIIDDRSKGQKFLRVWNERVHEAPAEFRDHFLGGVKATMEIGFDDDSEVMKLEGSFLADDGRTVIGSYKRNIDFKRDTAESEYFKLTGSETGRDIGKRVLAGNVATYQSLGLNEVEVHANIDVGGYAWAKYGYVPNDSSWDELRDALREKVGGGGSSASAPDSWDNVDRDQQREIKAAWKSATKDDFHRSEVENWRESGQALDDAKSELAKEFRITIDNGREFHVESWPWQAMQEWRRAAPEDQHQLLTNDKILAAVDFRYAPTGDGANDPKVTVYEAQTPGLTQESRDAIAAALTSAFNNEADERAQDLEPPDFYDAISESQDDTWENMDDEDKLRWASENNDLHGQFSGGGSGSGDIDGDTAESIRELLDSDDPKAIWAIADSSAGKDLLLGTDWDGVLDLSDGETMRRFNAYVGKH